MKTSVSDGRLEIFDEFIASWEDVDELSAEEHVRVDTSRDLDVCVEEVRARAPAYR